MPSQTKVAATPIAAVIEPIANFIKNILYGRVHGREHILVMAAR
jgi:hypothetical protein